MKRFLLGLVLLGALASGYVYWQRSLNRTPSATSMAGGKSATADAVPVHTTIVGRRDFPVYLKGLGTAQAWNTVQVRSRVDGQVEKIAFTEGQPVKEGDLLVQLDARPFQAALDQAAAKITQDQASLSSAEADLSRTKSLIGNGYATKQLFDQQTATVKQLNALIQADQAALENAKVQLGYTTIRSPISGRSGLRTIDVGNIVHAADTNGIVTIAQIQPIAVLFTAPEEDLPEINRNLKNGALKLWAMTPDGKSELGQGELQIVNNDIDTASGTIRLKGRFANLDDTLWPGLSVSTRLLVSTLPNVVVVPDAAVQRGPSGLYAYVANADWKAEKRQLKVGASGGGSTVIEAGLQPGDEVVTAGHYRVQVGVPLNAERDNPDKTARKQAEPEVE